MVLFIDLSAAPDEVGGGTLDGGKFSAL